MCIRINEHSFQSISSEQEEKGQLSEFYKLFNEHHNALLNELAVQGTNGGMTLFAPNNKAFSMVKPQSLEQVITDYKQYNSEALSY